METLWNVITTYYPRFISGFLVTLRLVGVSFLIAMALGLVVAALRVQPLRWLRALGLVFVETFRNVPLLVLLFIMFAGLRRAGVGIDRFTAASVALGLYTSAYVAEAIRSGVFAVGRGQIEAGLSLGFTYGRVLRRIVLPQAVRTVIPPLGSITIAMIKNSAICGVAFNLVKDIMFQARYVNSRTLATNEAFFWAALGYLILTISATVIVRKLETRLAIRR